MMKSSSWISILVVGIVAVGLAGCGSSSDSGGSGDAAPKGTPPVAVEAPTGALTPEQRGAQHNGPDSASVPGPAAAPQTGAQAGPQDGGGQDGK